MSKRSTAGCTTKASVGYQNYVLVQSLSCKCGGNCKHFAHSRSTLWSFIADHNNIALVDFASLYCRHCFAFVVEYTCWSCMLHKFFCTGRTFYYSSIRSKVSKQNCKAAVIAERIFNRADSFRVAVYNTFNIFCNSFSSYCDERSINKIFLCKLCKHCLNTTCFVKLTHKGMTGRSQMTQVWCAVRNIVYFVKINCKTCFACNSRDMKHCIA